VKKGQTANSRKKTRKKRRKTAVRSIQTKGIMPLPGRQQGLGGGGGGGQGGGGGGGGGGGERGGGPITVGRKIIKMGGGDSRGITSVQKKGWNATFEELHLKKLFWCLHRIVGKRKGKY